MRLIGGKAYDSDSLDRRLDEECGFEKISPQTGETEQEASRQNIAPLQAARGRGVTVRVAARVSQVGHALRISCRILTRNGPTRLHEDHAEGCRMCVYRTRCSSGGGCEKDHPLPAVKSMATTESSAADIPACWSEVRYARRSGLPIVEEGV